MILMNETFLIRCVRGWHYPGLCVMLLAISACTTTPAPQSSNYLDDKSHSIDGRLFIGPQPELVDIEQLRDNGFTKVISFRTPDEMKELSFDEATALSAAGITYRHIPVGGDEYPYSPAQLQSLIPELENSNDKILLHCRSGWRASVITVAWLVEEQGMSLAEAVQHAEGWWPLSLEKVLDRKLELVDSTK